MSTTAGSSSMSSSIASAASRASASVSATTAAIGSPTWRTLPSASTGCFGSFIGWPKRSVTSQPQGMPPTPSKSFAVKTLSTPGIASAARGVERADPAVRHVRAQEVHVGLPGPVEVVGVAALAGQEAHVLAALGGCADAAVECHRPAPYSAATRDGAELLRRRLDRLDDVVVAGAAADVAVEILADLRSRSGWRSRRAAPPPSSPCPGCRSRTAGRGGSGTPPGSRRASRRRWPCPRSCAPRRPRRRAPARCRTSPTGRRRAPRRRRTARCRSRRGCRSAAGPRAGTPRGGCAPPPRPRPGGR